MIDETWQNKSSPRGSSGLMKPNPRTFQRHAVPFKRLLPTPPPRPLLRERLRPPPPPPRLRERLRRPPPERERLRFPPPPTPPLERERLRERDFLMGTAGSVGPQDQSLACTNARGRTESGSLSVGPASMRTAIPHELTEPGRLLFARRGISPPGFVPVVSRPAFRLRRHVAGSRLLLLPLPTSLPTSTIPFSCTVLKVTTFKLRVFRVLGITRYYSNRGVSFSFRRVP